MAGNIGNISYCTLYCSAIDGNAKSVTDLEGFRSLELGSPSGENKSVSGSRNSFAVVDDIESSVYRNASIVVLEGSILDVSLRALFELPNYGCMNTISYYKCENSQEGQGINRRLSNFIIRCLKTSGQRTGYAITGNGDEVALITYPMELQLINESIDG